MKHVERLIHTAFKDPLPTRGYYKPAAFNTPPLQGGRAGWEAANRQRELAPATNNPRLALRKFGFEEDER